MERSFQASHQDFKMCVHSTDTRVRLLSDPDGRHTADKPPVVFLHGYGESIERMEPTAVDVLRGTQRYGILLDLPGMGESGAPPEYYSMHELGEWLRSFIRYFNLMNCDVVGFSLGARVIIEALLQEPSIFRRTVLLSSGGIDTEDEAFKQTRAASFEKVFGSNLEKIPESIRSMMARVFARDMHTRDSFAGMKSRGLVVYGSNDRLVPSGALHVVTDLWKDATGHYIDGAGHRILRKAEHRNQVLDLVVPFLS